MYKLSWAEQALVLNRASIFEILRGTYKTLKFFLFVIANHIRFLYVFKKFPFY